MKYHKLRTGEQAGTYIVDGPITKADILKIAGQIARQQLAKGKSITSSSMAFDQLKALLQHQDKEHFCGLFLDAQHRVIRYEVLSVGTIDGASVYPREVVKRALALNAAAVIFAHNHPSGNPQPSEADIHMTRQLKEVLKVIDVQTLDHVVIGGDQCVSLAQLGRI